MLSYQHIYHAGNLADVHKHALLAWVLAYLTAKDKPLSYLETHAGRGLYALDAPEALKTGEAAAGITRMQARFAPDHPYRVALNAIHARHGENAYPGSPLIAATLLRAQDSMALAELHPREFAALRTTMAGTGAHLRHEDGLDMAMSICPPTPRRGVLMIDPSYEVKEDYARLPKLLGDLRRKWNVGVLMLWYPVLQAGMHGPMLARIGQDHPDAAVFEIAFPPVRQGHRMVGAGLVVVNPPWGMAQEAQRVKTLLAQD
ncbi:23S rRNA (adenine(2030)-N(6))-methyltransferase RlmJ [Roseinatronobacter alkalisoli]|uniref:Ribosomal RNA large subunit methyltransferase J n=1 Tax=Roseinatronobacter alkalisoli TaxID=3028235 RepID=A0ABT5T683_9RHOB|nr:23S rRNA (adenine(2030)-N(6))-methyltransferase RlmJ [Roseinatronobacter sp. HJB301]MDD7970554.1 23S rRNA (adenine(2030)-N(6))-methyltransferase RlmJ [Roseinatronobacter sp. HJB301]